MAVDYFLKLDTVDGEAKDKGHESEIKLDSFSWGGSQTTTVSGTGGSGAGKVNLSDFNILKVLDKATPKLLQGMSLGTHFKTGKLSAIKAGAKNKPYLVVDFEELFVTSIQLSASSEVPSESVSFSYNKVTMNYSTQDEQGNLTKAGEWEHNVKTNETKE